MALSLCRRQSCLGLGERGYLRTGRGREDYGSPKNYLKDTFLQTRLHLVLTPRSMLSMWLYQLSLQT